MKITHFATYHTNIHDKVWDFNFKWGRVVGINIDEGTITVYFPSGCLVGSNDRTLFWDEIKYDIPEMPKRKKKVQIEVLFVVVKYEGNYIVMAFQQNYLGKFVDEVYRWNEVKEFEVDEE